VLDEAALMLGVDGAGALEEAMLDVDGAGALEEGTSWWTPTAQSHPRAGGAYGLQVAICRAPPSSSVGEEGRCLLPIVGNESPVRIPPIPIKKHFTVHDSGIGQ
jgi:hypothetical protein